MHMFIYNTQHFLYPWNGWIKNKSLPSRQYTLCLYVHIMQYVLLLIHYASEYILHVSVYKILIAIIANAPRLFRTLASLVYRLLSNRPHLLPFND